MFFFISIYIKRIMNFINRSIYGTICLFRNRGTLELLNDVINIENYNMIIPNLYLGNINGANDIEWDLGSLCFFKASGAPNLNT